MIDAYILYGAPGVGKGTISKQLPKNHILGTGTLLRQQNLGLDGKLIPDDFMNDLVHQELKKFRRYVVFDGYPRTLNQVDYLLKLPNVQIRRVYELTCPDSELFERLTRRESCVCGASYHPILKPSQKEGICNLCGQKLFHRKDDTPEIVKKRLAEYHHLTEPILKKFGSLVTQIDVSQNFNQAVQSVVKSIKSEQTCLRRPCRVFSVHLER